MAERAGSHNSKPRLLIIRVGAAILAIAAALSFAQRIRAVAHRYDDVDFAIFYGWWTDYSSGGDPWVVQSKKIDLRPGLSRPHYCNYTPFFVEVFSPLARLDQKTAFWIWEAAQMLCLVGAVLMLARANAPPLGAAPTIIVLSLVMLSRQFAGALVAAQVTPMLLALLSASWLCARRERPAAAGLCLALAALLKLYPAGAAGYFLFGRRWRALGWTIGFFAAGVLLTNPFRWSELVTLELPVSYHIVGRAELTVLPFVRKIVAHFAGTTIIAAPFVAVVAITALIDLALLAIAAAATITSRERADLDGLIFGLWIALALLMSPLAWIPETLLLLPAYWFGMLAAWDGFQSREAARQIALIAGAAMLAGCIATALIKAAPHPGFPVLLAAYLSAALIFRARVKMDSPRDETRRLAS
ncbi:glycosyltransferase family 87 protein [Candidatus Binatus sp.]|uniref:glycosyltransferase family 87 protein n=1 Tax=Candidatus Binatus sp. TaxID=2811406 RepID=UPI002F932574